MARARILILTADIGAGHDLPAKLLAEGIASSAPGAEVTIVDGIQAMGPIVQQVGRRSTEFVLERLPWLYDLEYWLIARFRPTKWFGSGVLYLLGRRGLERAIEAADPDVIVSTYPGTSEAIGRLRRAGRLQRPCVSAITDLAALGYWAHPGIDRHLIIHEESRAEVRAVAGRDTEIVHVRGLSRPEFEAPPGRDAARTALGLPAEDPVVVVSGGGWGVGDLERAARTVLAIRDSTAVCLCGSNAGLQARLGSVFGLEQRVRVEGFTDRMAEWLSAADVLVHSTAGLTVLEAQMCGTWAISYGWGVGHIRVNNHAYRRWGLADVAGGPAELAAALRRALRTPRPRDFDFSALPAAADAVLELRASIAGRGHPDPQRRPRPR
jgi:processive 1,2-diacylglycerol beta-glucosyltransferase